MKMLLVGLPIVSTLFIAPSSARAQHFVEYGLNLSLGPIYIEDYRQGAEGTGAIQREAEIAGYGRIAGIANVGFGVNKARIDLAGTNPNNPFFFEYGFATSRYQDSILIDDPALNGTHGFFDVTLFVAGAGSVNLSQTYLDSPDTHFEAFWHAVINAWVDGVTTPTGPIQSLVYAGLWYKDWDSTEMLYEGDPLNTYQQTGTIEFIYGEPFFMECFVQTDVYFDNQISSVPGTLDASIDLGNSSYWSGITNLRDQFGNPVASATVTSSSGFDYQTPCSPMITAQPSPGAACPSQTVPFVVAATSSNPLAYAWQIETSPGVWQTLSDTPIALPCGGTAQASSPTTSAPGISVNPCPGVAIYSVRAVVSTACGTLQSSPAPLTVQPILGDADASGTVTFADVSTVLATWGQVYLPGTGPGDSDRDGAVDFADITSTLAHFGDACP